MKQKKKENESGGTVNDMDNAVKTTEAIKIIKCNLNTKY
jgi:hypothetical protein